MKHLKETRLKNYVLTALSILCFILSIVLPKVFSAAFPQTYEQNAALFTVLTVLVFWAIGIVLFSKSFKRLIITEALAHNEDIIRGDRKSFPSASGTFKEEDIRRALEQNGFTVTRAENGFSAVRQTKDFDCYVALTSSSDLSFFQEPDRVPKKKVGVIKIYLRDGVSESEQSAAKVIDGSAQYSVLTVFADRLTGLAYYNGGDFAASTSEYLAGQVILHNVLLRDTLPPKTEEDRTQDEIDLQDKDVRDLLYEFTHPGDKETAIAKTLQDGEIKADINGANGCLYYRTGDVVLAHPFTVGQDGDWTIADLGYVMTVLPKVRGAKNREILAFRSALERKLADDNITYRYQ